MSSNPKGPDRRPAPGRDRPPEGDGATRRELLVKFAMGGGLVAAYGTLAAEGLLFLAPERGAAPTQRIFLGRLDDFVPGSVETVHDLEGRAILIRRTAEGLTAFSSVCPHLGCQVHWQADENRFLCPCHRGLFDAEGVAYDGPPGDAGQRLAEVPLDVDEESGVVYLEVKAPEPREERS